MALGVELLHHLLFTYLEGKGDIMTGTKVGKEKVTHSKKLSSLHIKYNKINLKNSIRETGLKTDAILLLHQIIVEYKTHSECEMISKSTSCLWPTFLVNFGVGIYEKPCYIVRVKFSKLLNDHTCPFKSR